MKILIPVDGSAFSRRVLAWLSAHQEFFTPGNEYTLLHVGTPVPPRAAAVLDRALLKSYYEEQSAKVFKPMRSFFAKKQLAVRFESALGAPGEVIAKLADKGGFDLVMIGSHGHGALLNLVLGSVATQVLARCKVPVLVVR